MEVASREQMTKIVKRWSKATTGPYFLIPTHGGSQRILTRNRAANDIGLVYDSVAANAEFLAHSWADVHILMSSTMVLKAWIRGFFEAVQECQQNPQDDGVIVYELGITDRLIKQVKESLQI
jgi:hypothetical protein